MFLLDTNVCIDFAFARSDRLRARVRQQNGRGMAISSITVAELRLGARRPEADAADEAKVDIFVSILGIRDFDRAAAERYGALAAAMPVRRGSFDSLIAAHALSLGCVLVTNNERDFAAIPGLVVENWTR